MLAIGRGLMAGPQLLIMDEPSLGLSPRLVKETFKVIRRIDATGVGVLLVEQNARQTLAVAHRGYLHPQGRVVASGGATELAADDLVKTAYFV